MTCTLDIENSAVNEEGWYLYGRFHGRLFTVEALEPRAALRLEPTTTVSGREAVKEYLAEKQFAGLAPDLTRKTQWFPTAGKSDVAYLWPVGSRGMLVHVFGWRKSPAETKNGGVILGLVTGHFAFGEAEVVTCPFTGEPRWNIIYYQIYVHNPNGIVSCAQTWAAYMGNLRRGWMYTVPVGDTVVRLPAGGMVESGGQTIDWFKIMRREFNLMMALYRTGSGKGTTAVRTDVSCVQDSHAALFGTFRYFEDCLTRAGGADPRSEANPALKRTTKLVEALESHITFFGISSGKWREFYKKPLAERYSNPFTIILDSVLSAGTIFPRSGNDRLLALLANHELPMWNILTSQIGGRIEGLVPLAPSSPRHR